MTALPILTSMRKNYLLLIILQLPLLYACGPKTLVPQTYVPADKDRIVSVRDNGNVKVLVEHMPATGQHTVFDVEVVNESDEIVRIDPHSFSLYGSDAAFTLDPDTDADIYQQSFALALPEFRGQYALREKEVNRDIKRQVTTKKVLGAMLVVAATAVVVHDAVQDSKDYSKVEWTIQDARRSENRDWATATSLVTLDMISQGLRLSNEKQFEDLKYLPAEYLHEILVFPGESVRGKVFFHRVPCKFVRLILPVDTETFIVDLKRYRLKGN